MVTDCKSEKLVFQPCDYRDVVARFDGGKMTSDAGGLLLRELEQRFGLIERLADCFEDHRDPKYIEHTVEQLLAQRIFGLALGYQSLNDHDDLATDPVLAVMAGKDDPEGQNRRRDKDQNQPLAKKSTLNRLELGAVHGGKDNRYKKIVPDLEAIQKCLIDLWLQLRDDEPRNVILDFDATDIALHGDQQNKFYHGYYGHYCYLPLYVFAGQWLVSSLLRFAGQDEAADSLDVLTLLVDKIEKQWPDTQIVVRADSGFARDRIMDFCEEHGIDYVIGIAKNSRLTEAIEIPLKKAKQRSKESGEKVRRFDEFRYETLDSWSRKRRVVAKIEHTPKGSNPRFVVTSLSKSQVGPRQLYEQIYCQRGESENRIKEVQLFLFADDNSTHWMASNQLRVYFCSVAYLFICLIRKKGLRGTKWANAQAPKIREKLFKIGAQLEVTTRNVWLRMASSFPHQAVFRGVLQNIRAGPH